MSYYFSMAFATVPDETAAYELCQRAVKLLAEKGPAQKHIRNMYPFLVTRCEMEHVKMSSFITDMWVQDIFQLRFVYWKQHNLLALCGENYPKSVTDLFGPGVDFQNRIDQDYPFSAWDPDVSVFQTAISIMSESGADTLRSFLDFDENMADVEYMRRSAVYKWIFDHLDLENWLYGRDGQFERIRMSGLTSQEKIVAVQHWAYHMAITNKPKE